MKLYDHPSDQAAFDRWVDITAQLLQKYGPALLKQKQMITENENKKETLEFFLKQCQKKNYLEQLS